MVTYSFLGVPTVHKFNLFYLHICW